MRWWIEVSKEARLNLREIRHTKEDVEAISRHLSELAARAIPGDPIQILDGRTARYSAIGAFGIVFQLVPSRLQPPGKLVVTSIVDSFQ